MHSVLIALAATTVGATAPPHAAPALPGFAAQLAQRPLIDGPGAWSAAGKRAGWAALAHASPAMRQAQRWAYAVSLIAGDRAPEALGVLQVMVQDDPDLALVPAFQLARGVALTGLDRADEALTALGAPELAGNPEACAWRVRAFAQAGMAVEAMREVTCGLNAINARQGMARAPFVLAAARAALAAGKPQQGLTWLKAVPDGDPAANLLRARAYLLLGQAAQARLRIERAAIPDDPELRAGVRFVTIQIAVAGGLPQPRAIKQLKALRFAWRGGEVEYGACRLEFQLATQQRDTVSALDAGATLVRYFKPDAETAPLLKQMQAILTAMLAPGSRVPLPDAAGLYWEYREFAPAGSAGDALVSQLADRLEAAGLPARAADLLDYQLTARTTDVARGPLSVRVATLRILAGQPDRALTMLQGSEDPGYSDIMRWDRKRVEAVALFQTGKAEAAMAALQDVPDAAAIGAEIQWKQHDWNALAANRAGLPAPALLNDVAQAVVLRHAIALAVLGREDQLAALRTRYAKAFKQLPSGPAFDVLTQPAGSIDPATVTKAMAGIPSASPAGVIADLLDVEPAL